MSKLSPLKPRRPLRAHPSDRPGSVPAGSRCVSKDDIKVRMAIVDEDIWPMPSALGNIPPQVELQRTTFSQMMLDGRVVHTDVLEEIYAEINELYGTNILVPGGN